MRKSIIINMLSHHEDNTIVWNLGYIVAKLRNTSIYLYWKKAEMVKISSENPLSLPGHLVSKSGVLCSLVSDLEPLNIIEQCFEKACIMVSSVYATIFCCILIIQLIFLA